VLDFKGYSLSIRNGVKCGYPTSTYADIIEYSIFCTANVIFRVHGTPPPHTHISVTLSLITQFLNKVGK
jgi:hypothetical protein